MAKNQSNAVGALLSFLAWLTGIIVSLAIGFGMIDGTLAISWIGAGVTAFFGWIVVITTLLSLVLAIVKKFQ